MSQTFRLAYTALRGQETVSTAGRMGANASPSRAIGAGHDNHAEPLSATRAGGWAHARPGHHRRAKG
jgi:hypothetical protein